MRRFLDQGGRPWEVVLGRESWGTFVALFVPVGAGRTETVRQTVLHASAHSEAAGELDRLDDDALRALLERSTPHSP